MSCSAKLTPNSSSTITNYGVKLCQKLQAFSSVTKSVKGKSQTSATLTNTAIQTVLQHQTRGSQP